MKKTKLFFSILIALIAIPAAIIIGTRLFNHVDAWMGILFMFVIIAGALTQLITVLLKHFRENNQ